MNDEVFEALAIVVIVVAFAIAMTAIGAAIDNIDPNLDAVGHCPAPQPNVEYERCK